MPDLDALWSLIELDHGFALSPDGREIAIIERRMDVAANVWRHTLVLVEISSGRWRTVADAGDVILRSTNGRRSGAPLDRVPQYSPDGASLYFLGNFDGTVVLCRVQRSGGEVRLLAEFDGDVISFTVAASGDVIVETRTSRSTLVRDREQEIALGFLADEDFSPGYARTPLTRETRERASLTIDGRTGEARSSEQPSVPNGDEERVRIAPLDTASDAHAPPLGVFLITGSEEVRCPSPLCSGDIEAAWIHRTDSRESIIFQIRSGHARAYETVGEWRLGEDVRIVRQDRDRLSGCRLQEHLLICIQDETRTPRRLITIDLEHGGERVLYDPNPQWSRISLPLVERLEFTDGDGNQSFADLIYPTAYSRPQRYPLVVVQYRSRGFLAGGVGGETPIYALAARGYAVLSFDRPEFREREAQVPLSQLQREIELTGTERRSKRVALDHFISILVSRGVVDERRIGITGLSDGAETLYAMLIDEPGRFAAAVAGSPPTDPAGWWLNAPSYRAQSSARLGLTAPWEVAPSPWTAWWEANSPALRAGNIRTPLLMNLGESEALRAFPLITRLRDNGQPVEAFVYPGAYHVKSRPSHIIAAQLRTMAWLDFWLQHAPPELERPETAGATERWERMRARLLQDDSRSTGDGVGDPR